MDDAELINEVLGLTLAYQRGEATAEERARLERLLLDDPAAIEWYLRVVDDTITLRASASVPAAPPAFSPDGEPDAYTAAADGVDRGRRHDSTLQEAALREEHQTALREEVEHCRLVAEELGLAAGDDARWRAPRSGWSWAAAICLLAVAGWLAMRGQPTTDAKLPAVAGGTAARVMNLSNVAWSPGAKHYDEWSFLTPGESLRFERGLVNLFLDNGVELLIEGPADVDYVSLQKVFARQGKLAARVGPMAIGFSIETPHANVIDRGTSFGMSVDSSRQTDVVVYEGMVDLDVVGDALHARRRLERGEAMSVSRQGELRRITTVQSSEFLEPPQVRAAGNLGAPLIAAVSDNAPAAQTSKYYRVIPGGFREDCRAFVDRLHEWNGVDNRGLPPFLVGGDYVMTFNDDKITTEIEIAVRLAQPASLYVIIDDRVTPPEWLQRDFVDTNWDVGSDDGWTDGAIAVGVGPGDSIEHKCSVWRRDVTAPSTVILGALSKEEASAPAVRFGWSMYGIVATPLERKLAVRGSGAG